jgi:hypothetical protein
MLAHNHDHTATRNGSLGNMEDAIRSTDTESSQRERGARERKRDRHKRLLYCAVVSFAVMQIRSEYLLSDAHSIFRRCDIEQHTTAVRPWQLESALLPNLTRRIALFSDQRHRAIAQRSEVGSNALIRGRGRAAAPMDPLDQLVKTVKSRPVCC